jgi:hypothetical protein
MLQGSHASSQCSGPPDHCRAPAAEWSLKTMLLRQEPSLNAGCRNCMPVRYGLGPVDSVLSLFLVTSDWTRTLLKHASSIDCASPAS